MSPFRIIELTHAEVWEAEICSSIRSCRDIVLFRSKDLLRIRTRNHPLLWSRKLQQLDRLCQKNMEAAEGLEPSYLEYKTSTSPSMFCGHYKVFTGWPQTWSVISRSLGLTCIVAKTVRKRIGRKIEPLTITLGYFSIKSVRCFLLIQITEILNSFFLMWSKHLLPFGRIIIYAMLRNYRVVKLVR